jgi:hypothetical protein
VEVVFSCIVVVFVPKPPPYPQDQPQPPSGPNPNPNTWRTPRSSMETNTAPRTPPYPSPVERQHPLSPEPERLSVPSLQRSSSTTDSLPQEISVQPKSDIGHEVTHNANFPSNSYFASNGTAPLAKEKDALGKLFEKYRGQTYCLNVESLLKLTRMQLLRMKKTQPA